MSKHPVELTGEELLKQCKVTRTRRSGPGGQHRNKVETAIVLLHEPTGIQAEANEERSQPANQRVALKRLRIKLAMEFRQPNRAEQLPSQFWQNRFPKGRLKINRDHDDFAVALAEALDVLNLNQMEIRATAEQLQCSSSQFTQFLKIEPAVLNMVNKERKDLGYHTLK